MKRLFVKIMAAVAITVSATAQLNAQESFSYQAVIRNAEGQLVDNKEVGLRFSLMHDGEAKYVETQKSATNQYGNIQVLIGTGTKVSGAMAEVPWNTLDITLKVEVDVNGGTNYILLGETKINPAPYALYASSSSSAPSVNSSNSAKDNGNLFEVTDRNGNTVFAVTPNGIVVYVDDTNPDDNLNDKARRSGFIVRGRTATKDQPATEYFAVTAEGTHVYVDNTNSDKARRSGFLVRGRTATKDDNAASNYMAIDSDGTHIYIDDPDNDKARRSGFLVRGRTATKDDDNSYQNDLFTIDGSLTTVYVEDDNTKARRSGFLVRGRTATKGNTDLMSVTKDSTNMHATEFTVTERNNELGIVQSMISVNTRSNGQAMVMVNTDLSIDGETIEVASATMVEEFATSVTDSVWITTTTAFADFDPSFNRLMGIYDNGEYAPAKSDAMMGGFLFFDSNGYPTSKAQNAAVVVCNPQESLLIIRALEKFNADIEFGMMNDNNEFVKITVAVNSKDGKPINVPEGKFNGGTVTRTGDLYFGNTVSLSAKADKNKVLFGWEFKNSSLQEPIVLPYSQYDFSLAFEFMGYSICPVFDDPVLYVSDKGPESNYGLGGLTSETPLKTINYAVAEIYQISGINSENADWTIKVVGSVSGEQIIGKNGNSEIPAQSIRLTGFNGLNDKGLQQDSIFGAIPGTDDMGLPIDEKTTVLKINTSIPVTIDSLKICGGGTSDDPYNNGGGIRILEGDVTLGSGALVSNNEAKVSGGGVYVSQGKLTIENDAKISNNHATTGGGICIMSESNGNSNISASVIMNGGSISQNTCDAESQGELGGAGVLVYGENASFTMNNGSISQNSSNGYGGGVCVYYSGQFTMNDGTIGGKTSEDGNKANNTNNGCGGGVYISGQNSKFTMTGGNISHNYSQANDGYYNGNLYYLNGGGGVCVKTGIFEMTNGSISNNESENTGGGVWIGANAQFTMSGGSISRNTANGKIDGESDGNGKGGGVYLKTSNSSLTMRNSAVIEPYWDIDLGKYINDVYLPYDGKITVGQLANNAPDTVALITPENYNYSGLAGEPDSIAAARDKFAINVNASGFWKVASNGNLTKAQLVAFYNANQLLAEILVSSGEEIENVPQLTSTETAGFAGWKKRIGDISNPTYQPYNIYGDFENDEDPYIQLYANWQPYYKLTFNSRVDGVTFPDQQVMATKTGSEPDMTNVTKTGYEFAGWYYATGHYEQHIIGYINGKIPQYEQIYVTDGTRKFDLSAPLPEEPVTMGIELIEGQMPTINLYANWVASNLYVNVTGGDNNNSGISGKPLQTIQAAIDTIRKWNVADWDYTITVLGMSEECVTINGGTDVDWPVNANSITLKNYNNNEAGIAGTTSSNTLLTVKTSAKVILDGFTIKPTANLGMYTGTNSNYRNGMVLYVGQGADVTLKGNTVLDGELAGDRTEKNYNGAAYVDKGTLTMTDNAVIKNFGVKYGGGVYVYGNNSPQQGKFTMSGYAAIESCKAGYYGGGVYVNNGGDFVMNDHARIGGEGKGCQIPNNDCGGGGVYVNNGSFTMNDNAEISYNSSNYDGGGVYVAGYGKFTMTGGTIAYNNITNTSHASGCGVYIACQNGGGSTAYPGIFDMQGGTITNNGNTTNASTLLGKGVWVGYCKTNAGASAPAIFKMGGSAKVDVNNDVNMSVDANTKYENVTSSAKITITSNLDNDMAALIVMSYNLGGSYYQEDLQVLTTENGASFQNTKFAVVDQVDGSTTTYWKVNENGRLAKRPMVTFINGGNTFAELPVDINGHVTFPEDVPDNTSKVFKGWAESATGGSLFDPNTIVTANKTLYAVFANPVVEVAPGANGDGFTSPAGSIADAIQTINNKDRADLNWTIKINGTLTGAQTVSGGISASMLTIEGKTEPVSGATEPIDAIDGQNIERSTAVLSINTNFIDNEETQKMPIVIKNLKITGGNNTYDINGNANGTGGGGLYVSRYEKVSLADGTLIARNKALYGGGAYFDYRSQVYMYGSAVIGDQSATTAATETNCSNSATCGGGVYACGSFYMGCSSYTIESINNEAIYIYNDVNGAGGIFYNYASADGGGIYTSGGIYTTRVSGTIANNGVGDGGNGGAVYVHGSFSVGGAAYIPAGLDGKHDVCLSYNDSGHGKYFNVELVKNTTLSHSAPVAQITPARNGNTYWNDDFVLTGAYFNNGNTELISKFAVTPIVTGTTIQYYKIDDTYSNQASSTYKKLIVDGDPVTIPTLTGITFTNVSLADAGNTVTATISGSNFSQAIANQLKAVCPQDESIVANTQFTFNSAANKLTATFTVPNTTGDYQITIGTYGVTPVTGTLTVTEVTSPTGAINGKFSIGENKQVYFSRGNLQYNTGTPSWQFATNQYEYVGGTQTGTHVGNVSGSSNTNLSGPWIDLFGWGTGNNPTENSDDEGEYSIFTDWGNSAIINGGGEAAVSKWRTLKDDEWSYLLNYGTYTNTTREDKYGEGKIDGVNGLILLPDDWIYPTDLSTNSTQESTFKPGGSNWENTYTATDWEKMEAAGAVFLPAAGGRNVNDVDQVGILGYYWTESESVKVVSFASGSAALTNGERHLGFSVRLVQDVE